MNIYTLVTGATSDIGMAICQKLAAEGHRLLLSDLSEESLAKALVSLGDGGHLAIPLDLSRVEESRQTFSSYLTEHDIAVTHAVFAAGIFTVKPLKLMSHDFLIKNFDIALFSMLILTQVLTSRKVNSTNLQSIVAISSVSALMGTKGYSAYGAVKAAIMGAVKSMAVELAPRVRVNAILPGGMRTKATEFLYDNDGGNNPRYLLGEGRPIDVANMASFLLSDNARWITGQHYVVDGGLTIC